MKRSKQVPASLIAAMAAGMAVNGCGPQQDCVDAQGRITPDVNCQSGSRGYRWSPRRNVGGGGFGTTGSGGFFGG
ncbi:MAG: hypothetical protein ACAH95_18285 [Fimbriimonas sp.]